MTIDWTTDVVARGLDSQTDSAIAAALAGSGLTAHPIPLDAFRDFLRAEGLVTLGSTFAGFDGPLADATISPASPAPLVAGLKKLFTHVFATGKDHFSTTDAAIAAETRQLAGVLVASGRMTAQQLARMYALGGSERYAGTAAADVADARQRNAAAQARAAIVSRLNESVGKAVLAIDAGGNAAAAKAAFDARWVEG